jgi:hypothetical protein
LESGDGGLASGDGAGAEAVDWEVCDWFDRCFFPNRCVRVLSVLRCFSANDGDNLDH